MAHPIDRDVRQLIEKSQTCLVVSHVRPDADAVGSLLGFGLGLRAAGKDVQMVLEDSAKKFHYLPGYELITTHPTGEFDLIAIVDCSDPERAGKVLDAYPQPDLVVDHHKTNLQFGKINVVEEEQVATAAILYDRLPMWGLTISPEVATCLLTGIVGDTIGFRTPNVDSAVMRKVSDLMDLGANLAEIYRQELVLKSLPEVRYWGAGLSHIQHEGSLVWTSLTLVDREKVGYAGNDDADLVNVLSAVQDAIIALIFIEQPHQKIKVSWRAQPGIDVSEIAFAFGGGGHAAAAGADIDGSLEDVMAQVVAETKKLLPTS